MNVITKSVGDSTAGGSVKSLRFSLVLATIGRTEELANFLVYLNQQTYREFEVIVVDQNGDDRLVPILASYHARFPIRHIRSERGLSHARNVGLQHIGGDVVAFPDDDCWYAPDVLERTAGLFLEHPEWDGLTGKCNAPQSFHFLDDSSGQVNKFNVWRRATSVTIFLRTNVIKLVGGFDENLGAGAASGFAAAEETDYLLRALHKECRLYYRPDILVDHPDSFPRFGQAERERAGGYARGVGYALRKHEYPAWFVGYVCCRALGGAVIALLKLKLPKAQYHVAVFKGRLLGWL